MQSFYTCWQMLKLHSNCRITGFQKRAKREEEWEGKKHKWLRKAMKRKWRREKRERRKKIAWKELLSNITTNSFSSKVLLQQQKQNSFPFILFPSVKPKFLCHFALYLKLFTIFQTFIHIFFIYKRPSNIDCLFYEGVTFIIILENELT